MREIQERPAPSSKSPEFTLDGREYVSSKVGDGRIAVPQNSTHKKVVGALESARQPHENKVPESGKNSETSRDAHNPNMKLSDAVADLKSKVAEVEARVAENANILVGDIACPQEGSDAAEVRRAIYEVFKDVSAIIGRSSELAVKGDTAVMVDRVFDMADVPRFDARRNPGDTPEKWFFREVVKRLDGDMKGHAFKMAVLSLTASKEAERFMEVIRNWRSRGTEGVESFVVARRHMPRAI